MRLTTTYLVIFLLFSCTSTTVITVAQEEKFTDYEKQYEELMKRMKELKSQSDNIAQNRQLYEQLSDEERDLLVRAIWANQDSHTARLGLLLAATDSKAEIRQSAMYYIKNLCDPFFEDPLISLLEKNQGYDAGIIAALGNLKSEKPVPLLTKILSNEENPGPASVAAEALGKIGNKESIPALKEAFKSNDDLLKARSAKALALLGDKTSYSWAIDCLANVKVDDTFDSYKIWHYKELAADVLGEIGSAKDIEFLKRFIPKDRMVDKTGLEEAICRAMLMIMDHEELFLDDWKTNPESKKIILGAFLRDGLNWINASKYDLDRLYKNMKVIERVARANRIEIFYNYIRDKEIGEFAIRRAEVALEPKESKPLFRELILQDITRLSSFAKERLSLIENNEKRILGEQ